MDYSTLFMMIGFLIASYSIVSNDAIQTLGTFLSSNSKRPWWMLWAYCGSILTAVLLFGWFTHDGDVTYGRLDQIPKPDQLQWWHVIPPVVLVILTRRGIPVSTTFLVLSVFTPGLLLGKILLKSLIGYAMAFGAAIAVWTLLSRMLEKRFIIDKNKAITTRWMAAQWVSTGFLWAMWLIQDFANIYVYLPRKLELTWLLASLVVMLAMLAVIFRNQGGRIQQIVLSKTNTTDIRSATIIDLTFAVILLYFKKMNNLPMSTTWVFLGVLAGREFAISHRLQLESWLHVAKLTGRDFGRAAVGLIVSLLFAFGLKFTVIPPQPVTQSLEDLQDIATHDIDADLPQVASTNEKADGLFGRD